MHLLVAFSCWLIGLLLCLFQLESHRQHLLARARAVDDATLAEEAREITAYEAIVLDGEGVATAIALAVHDLEKAGVLQRTHHPEPLSFCDAFAVGPSAGAVALDGLQERVLACVRASRGLSMLEITRDLQASEEVAELLRRVRAKRRRLFVAVPFWESMPNCALWRRFHAALFWLTPLAFVLVGSPLLSWSGSLKLGACVLGVNALVYRCLRTALCRDVTAPQAPSRDLLTPNHGRLLRHWRQRHGPLPTAAPSFKSWLEQANHYHSYL